MFLEVRTFRFSHHLLQTQLEVHTFVVETGERGKEGVYGTERERERERERETRTGC